MNPDTSRLPDDPLPEPPAPRTSRRRRLGEYGAPGTAPGIFRVSPDAEPTSVEVFGYDPDRLERLEDATLDDVQRISDAYDKIWVNVFGLADVERITRIAELFSLHDLAMEDVFHTKQRPKSEPYPDHHFLIVRYPRLDDIPETEQLALFVGKRFVISFQELPGDCFDGVRNRLAADGSRIRDYTVCYLAYALIDAVIDSYFPVLERIGDDLDALEIAVVENAEDNLMERLHLAKRDVSDIRRAIWPHREAINAILRGDSPFFTERTLVYLRDCYDHVTQIMDLVDSDRDFASDLRDVHLSLINLRMNEVMKVLTTIATIFIPLGFVAGLYGMNFDPEVSPWNMPELRWVYGYPYSLILMLAIAGGLAYYLYRKGWLRPDRQTRSILKSERQSARRKRR